MPSYPSSGSCRVHISISSGMVYIFAPVGAKRGELQEKLVVGTLARRVLRVRPCSALLLVVRLLARGRLRLCDLLVLDDPHEPEVWLRGVHIICMYHTCMSMSTSRHTRARACTREGR